MNSKIYRQADSRWGKLPYPTKNYTFAHNGCGCCACTHNIIEIPKYANYTPADVRPYMVGQGFATKGHGTTWNGITLTLRHYGFGVEAPNISSSMTGAWNLLNKTGAPKQGVLLFRAGVKGGVRWTSGGHYVAFLNYKVQNGKHYFYTKDSGGRHHDGWYCYETTMRGLLPKIWIVTSKPSTNIPTVTKPTGKYSGTLPTSTLKNGTKSDDVAKWQNFLNWYHSAWKLSVDKNFGNKTGDATMSFQKTEGITADGVVGKNTLAKASAYLSAPTPKPTGKYSGTIPTPTIKNKSNGTNVKNLQKFLNWYGNYGLSVDGKCGTKTVNAIKAFQTKEGIKADGIYGNASYGKAKAYAPPSSIVTKPTTSSNAQKLIAQMDKLAWKYGTAKSKYAYKTGAPTSACKTAMKKYGYNTKEKWSDCGRFVNTVVREAGIDKSFTSLHGVKKAFPKSEKAFNIVFSGKSIPSGVLKAGDIIRYKKTGDDQHAMFYYGNGKVCDAGHYNRFGNIRADEKRYSKSNVKKSTIQVLRVKE